MKLNIGSYTDMFRDDWVNIDILPLHQYAQENRYQFVQMDVRYGLFIQPQSVDFIYTSHFFEHLTYDEGFVFLHHCKHAMKEGAVMRLSVPDLELLTARYLAKDMAKLDRASDTAAKCDTQARKLYEILCQHHLSFYDYEALEHVTRKLEFSKIERKDYGKGHPVFEKETKDFHPEISLYVEITK